MGMTGQSSGLTTWCAPNVYQTTTSVFVMERLAAVYAGRPATRMLVRVVARGASLARIIRRNPQVFRCEACSP